MNVFTKRAVTGVQGGGGARLGYISFSDTHAQFNSMSFENCSFSRNFAYYGGGLSFYAAREPDEVVQQTH